MLLRFFNAKTIINKAFSIILALLMVIGTSIFPLPTVALTNKSVKIKNYKQRKAVLDRKKQIKQKQLNELRTQKNTVSKTLRSNQLKLDLNRRSLKDNQYKLNQANKELMVLQRNFKKLNDEQERLKKEASKRIRQIYKGGHLSFLHIILGAKSITDFMDRLYYQQRIIKRDKNVLQELNKKTLEFKKLSIQLNQKKEQIVSRINDIQKIEREYAIQVASNKAILNKLKTDINAYERAYAQLARDSNSIQNEILSLTTGSSPYSNVTYSPGGYLRPVVGRITSPYGYRSHPIFKRRKFHTGVDIAGPNRSPIKATKNGVVIRSGWLGGYGKVVVINHGNGITSLYAHLSSAAVSKGQSVSKGQVVGYEGSTGYSTGPHLHFEIRKNGRHTNPLNYIR